MSWLSLLFSVSSNLGRNVKLLLMFLLGDILVLLLDLGCGEDGNGGSATLSSSCWWVGNGGCLYL